MQKHVNLVDLVKSFLGHYRGDAGAAGHVGHTCVPTAKSDYGLQRVEIYASERDREARAVRHARRWAALLQYEAVRRCRERVW